MASRTIKGITVEIGADNTKFNKAFKEIDKTSRETQLELRQVNRALKLDPQNADLIKQKQELLTKAIGESKDKLEMLKEAQSKFTDEMKQTDEGAAQYRSLQREVIKTEQEIQRLEKEASEANSTMAKVGEVDQSLRSTQRELQQVNQALKLDPNNIELVKQKQELMTKAVSESREKLELLKEAQSEFTDEMKQTEEGAAQYRSLQREIAETEQGLQGLQAETDKTTTNMTEKIGGAVAIGDLVSQGIQKAIGLLKQFAQYAAEAWQQFDEGADIATRTTGATGQSAEQLNENYANVARQILASNEDIGKAVGEVSTRFHANGEELEHLSVQFLKFAQVNSVDVVNAVDSVQKSLTAYGLDLSNADGAMDTLTATSQKYGVSVDTLTNGLIQNGAAFQEMGLSYEQSADFMGQLEISGANGETVMQGLRKALKNATADGKDMNTALAELQDGIQNGTGSMDGLTLAYDLFGKSGDQIYAAVKNGTLSFKDLANVSTETSGALNNTFNETQDAPDKLGLAFQRLKTDIGQVADKILVALEPAIDWFIDNFDTLEPIIVAVAAALGVLAGALAIGALISGVSAALSVLGGVLAFAFSPITLIVAAIVGLVAGLVMLWTKCEWFREGVKNILNTIKTFIDNAWNGFMAWIDGINQAIGGFVDSVVQTASGFLDNILSSAANLKDGVVNKFSEIMDSIVGWAGGLWNGVKDGVKGFASNVVDGFKNLKKNAVKNLTNVAKGVLDLAGNILSFRSNIRKALFKIADQFFDSIGGLPKKMWDWGTDAIGGFIDGLLSGLDGVGSAASGIAGKVWEFLHFSRPETGPLRDYETWMPDFVSGLASSLKKAQPMLNSALNGLSGSLAIAAQPRIQPVGSNTTNADYSTTTINVYAQPGQDVDQLADAIERRLAHKQQQKEAVFR